MRRRVLMMLAIFAGAFGSGLIVAGLSDDEEPPTGLPRAGVRGTAEQPAQPRRRARPRPPARLRVSAAVRTRAAAMTLPERVAQLFLVGFEGTEPAAPFFGQLQSRGWGGVVLTEQNFLSDDQLAGLAGEAAVVARNAGRVVPLVAAEGVPGFEPPPQSPADRPAQVRSAAQAQAVRLRQAGITLILGPSADVGIESSEGTYGDDPATVARLTTAAVTGYLAGGVVPAVGHFPGQGAASQDPLDGPSSVGLSAEELRDRDFVPFAAVARRAPAVVVSSAAFPAYDPVTPAALARGVLRELRSLGFRGVAMTDDFAGVTAATGGGSGEAAVAAVAAGIDMLRITDPAEAEAGYAAVLQAAQKRELAPARLRDAVHRVLEMKRAAGLL